MMQSFDRLREIFEHQVFELCGPFETETGIDYYVPYMMNDALEYYLTLQNCRLVGEYLHDTEVKQDMQLAEGENGYVLAVRQGNENAFTLYFENIEENVKFYQYHEIGHFWVEGQEHWRQLVYIIGTIYDKYMYLGEWSCNEKEMELLPLIEFGPFREWSPIHESLEEMYPETYNGIHVAKKFAEEARDKEFVRWISLYEKFPSRSLYRLLSRKLLSNKREDFYELIWSKVEAASLEYPTREYGVEIAQEIENIRTAIADDMRRKGFGGTYPFYEKDNTRIIAMEEHPFTIMEWEHYKFKVQFMVSQCDQSIKHRRNSGFFKGRGRKGWIEKYESI